MYYKVINPAVTVIRAQAMGLCFGVRDALELTRSVPRPQAVTIHGELVHNTAITDELTQRGYVTLDEAQRARGELPVTHTVMITAHGIANAERARLEAAGKTLIDTTCPLVRRAHEAALRLANEGRHMLVIGRRGHVEVLGLTGDLPAFDILESPRDVRTYAAGRLGVVCQTTSVDRDVRLILDTIWQRNVGADIAFVNTICQPTRDRQIALEKLLGEVDLLVVVGGRHSNNTQRLVARAAERGVSAHHVEGPADLDPRWLFRGATVGLTAGTSTPDEAIDAVHESLLAMAPSGEKR